MFANYNIYPFNSNGYNKVLLNYNCVLYSVQSTSVKICNLFDYYIFTDYIISFLITSLKHVFSLLFFATASHIFPEPHRTHAVCDSSVSLTLIWFDQIQQNCLFSALRTFWDVWRHVSEIQIFKAASIILDIRCSSSTFTSESI